MLLAAGSAEGDFARVAAHAATAYSVKFVVVAQGATHFLVLLLFALLAGFQLALVLDLLDLLEVFLVDERETLESVQR